MKVVNPIGRKAADAVTVNKDGCRCELKGTYSKGAAADGCYCALKAQNGQYHYVHQGY